MATLTKQDKQCTYRRNTEARSCNRRCSEKKKVIRYLECL